MNEQRASAALPLYEQDETAWLEETARLVSERRFAEIDHEHLNEYLSDMARRDKREVLHRLVVLLVHLLKWDHQREKRTRSWELTIQEQREELRDLLESRSLRNHAEQELGKAYQRAVRRAAVESNLAQEAFPGECPYALEQALGG